MKLHAFIENNLDAIVAEWEAFARTLLPAATSMSDLELRNHSREILVAIVHDMRTGQTESERSSKSTQAELAGVAAETIAAAHGALRHKSGFDIGQLVAEFRALRSSVLALWRRLETSSGKLPAIEEIARFNEAIDQALGESVLRYSKAVAASKDMFLAVLGHDLRNPVQAIEWAGHALAVPALPDAVRLKMAMRLRRASKAMNSLITDLLDFTRSRLGSGIPIERTLCHFGQLCEEAIDAAQAADPAQPFEQQLEGDLRLQADAARLRQVLSNLLNNAIQHGAYRSPVGLRARGESDAVVVVVSNAGKPIPPAEMTKIFEPLVQVSATSSDIDRRSRTSLGLGLFIVREIVLGHGGTVDVQSSAEHGTSFTVRLPRVPAQG